MEQLKLYTVKEVSDILNLQPGSIYEYIKNGNLKAQKIGGASSKHQWRIREEDLRNFLNNNKQN